MKEKELCELLMTALGCYKDTVRKNRHILNSVRVDELQKINQAMRMLSVLHTKPDANKKR